MTRVFDDPSDEQTPAEGDAPDETPGQHSPGQHSPGLGPTTWFQFVVAVLVGGVVGWFIVETMRQLQQVVPVTPLVMSVLMGLFGLLVGLWARLRGQAFLVNNPDRAAGTGILLMALGKTMIFTGALLAGGHVVYALLHVGQWAIPLPRERVINGTIAVVASLVLAAGGLLAERAARIR